MSREFHSIHQNVKLLVFFSIVLTFLDIFRPFPGFRSIRLIPRDTKNGEKVLFCFADFETTLQTTLVINTLQVNICLENYFIGLSI